MYKLELGKKKFKNPFPPQRFSFAQVFPCTLYFLAVSLEELPVVLLHGFLDSAFPDHALQKLEASCLEGSRGPGSQPSFGGKADGTEGPRFSASWRALFHISILESKSFP